MKIDGNYLVITTDNKHEYDIPMGQLSTVKGLENWLCHMDEKNWWNKAKANHMIEICENHFGYKFNGKTSY